MKNCEEQNNSWLACKWLASGQSAKGHMRSTCWKLKNQVPKGISHLGQLARWPTRCIANPFCMLSSFLYPHYISSHYPQNCKDNFREKTLEIHLRVRDCTPTILYTFLLVFLYFYLSNSIPFERFLAQTHSSPNLSIVSCFGAYEKHWMKSFFGGCNWS